MSEIIMSLAIIILVSLLVYSKAVNLKPLTFEPHEKFSKKNKWLVFIEIRCLFTCLNAFSQLFFTNNSTLLFLGLLDTITFGALFYLLATRKNSAFTFMYFMIPYETFLMVLNANIANETTEYTLIFTAIYIFVWLLPNYIYFIKRRTLFTQLENNSVSDIVVEETLEEMKHDLAIALHQGNVELAQTISERISSVNNSNLVLENTTHHEENKFKIVISQVFIALSTLLGAMLSLGTAVFYVYTLYIYFVDYGFWAGFISIFLPVLSTIWLCILKWVEEGLYNTVTITGIIYIGIVAAMLIFYGLGSYIDGKINTENDE